MMHIDPIDHIDAGSRYNDGASSSSQPICPSIWGRGICFAFSVLRSTLIHDGIPAFFFLLAPPSIVCGNTDLFGHFYLHFWKHWSESYKAKTVQKTIKSFLWFSSHQLRITALDFHMCWAPAAPSKVSWGCECSALLKETIDLLPDILAIRILLPIFQWMRNSNS